MQPGRAVFQVTSRECNAPHSDHTGDATLTILQAIQTTAPGDDPGRFTTMKDFLLYAYNPIAVIVVALVLMVMVNSGYVVLQMLTAAMTTVYVGGFFVALAAYLIGNRQGAGDDQCETGEEVARHG